MDHHRVLVVMLNAFLLALTIISYHKWSIASGAYANSFLSEAFVCSRESAECQISHNYVLPG